MSKLDGARKAAFSSLHLCRSSGVVLPEVLNPSADCSRQVRGIANEATTTRAAGASRWLRETRKSSRCGGLRGISRASAELSSSCRTFASSAAIAAAPSSSVGRYLAYGGLLGGSGLLTYYTFHGAKKEEAMHEEQTIINWSGTHEASTRFYFQPQTLRQLESIVEYCHRKKQRMRPVGTGLSPNGIGLSDEGMVNLEKMDKVLHVDAEKRTVTVQAGAQVQDLVDALRPHGLTLQNFASIRQQQVGGFIQVGAHGTGSHIPPVDEQVLSLKLVTPGKGTLDLSAESDPDLFRLARCGLGALGVVAEVTLQCVPAHRLLEYTFVTHPKVVKKKHTKWLRENKHMRYMWIPDADCVVVVQCNPWPEGKDLPSFKSKYTPDDALKPARDLYREAASKYQSLPEASDRTPVKKLAEEELQQLTFTELRDKLIALDPLNRDHIVSINRAEAEYWKRSEGYRHGWSDQILGFDCGGAQWVSEVCFHTGTVTHPDTRDLTFMRELLHLIQKDRMPAPAPIEQRWTARSSSSMSPASDAVPECIFSWVGIINYLPTEDDMQRAAITRKFFEYRKAAEQQLWDRFGAYEHWAKIEIPEDEESLKSLREKLRRRYPVDDFNKARKELDPHNILANRLVDQLFPLV